MSDGLTEAMRGTYFKGERINVVEDILDTGDTSLDHQIKYMEKLSKHYNNPLYLAIINSLKELKANKLKDIPKK